MPAGLLRRGGALYLDLGVAVVPAVLIALLPALFIPLDRNLGLVTAIALPMGLAALAYVFAGPALLSNTLGRWVMGIRVVDGATGGRPRAGQAFVRMLPIGLWPVEALLIASSASKRRLGDRWANTDVVRYAPAAPLGMRLLPVAVVLLLGLGVFPLIPAITGRMDVVRAAQAYARAQRLEPAGAPGRVEVLNDRGTVALGLVDGGAARVHLARRGNSWTAERMERIPREELGGGFAVEYGSTAASAPP